MKSGRETPRATTTCRTVVLQKEVQKEAAMGPTSRQSCSRRATDLQQHRPSWEQGRPSYETRSRRLGWRLQVIMLFAAIGQHDWGGCARGLWQTGQTLTLMGANITTWGPQAANYLGSRHTEAQIACLVEHRQGPEQLEQMRAQLKRSNWLASISASVPFTAPIRRW